MSGEPRQTTYGAGLARSGAGAGRLGAGSPLSRGGTVALVLDGAGRAGTERHVLGAAARVAGTGRSRPSRDLAGGAVGR